MRSKWGFVGILVLFLCGAGMLFGAAWTYHDQHSGTAGKVKVDECHGHDGRYGARTTCTGTWVVGGSLVGGNGHVVIGTIENANYGDVGKTIDVRIHGSRHATKPSTRLTVILAVIGLFIAGVALMMVPQWWRSGSPSSPPAASSA